MKKTYEVIENDILIDTFKSARAKDITHTVVGDWDPKASDKELEEGLARMEELRRSWTTEEVENGIKRIEERHTYQQEHAGQTVVLSKHAGREHALKNLAVGYFRFMNCRIVEVTRTK